MSVVAIMTSVSLYYLYAHQKVYRPDEQASYAIDIMQEARQRALTQKATMRVEFDLTDRVVRLINEKDSLATTDDVVVRSINLRPDTEVRIDKRPDNISISPTETSPVDTITFMPLSVYPMSLNHRVATIRFRKDGTVTDAGTTPNASNSTVKGVTIFLWQPGKIVPDNSDIARAITVIGATGAMRLWNHHPGVSGAAQWKDSRRFQ